MCQQSLSGIGEPKDNHCHVYHINKDGPASDRPMKSQMNVSFDDEDFDDSMKMINGGTSVYNRFHFIHLPDTIGTNVKNPVCDTEQYNLHWKKPRVPKLPQLFQELLHKICPHCICKQEILWRTLFRQDHHFEACFRYVETEERPGDRCFLKLYSMRVPSLSYPKLTFSMVYHIRVEGDKFVPQENPEHLFAFISGVKSTHIEQLLGDLLPRFLDIRADHIQGGTSMTSRLFLAALLGGYGHIISPYVRYTADQLVKFDERLETALKTLKKPQLKNDLPSAPQTTEYIQQLNQDLIKFNRQLTGVRSTMRYLAGSAEVMVKDITSVESYITTRIDQWDIKTDAEKNTLKKELAKLDISRESLRDHDKLIMIRTNMFQYTTDIKSLQQHIDINVGMVRNVIAERDRSIQQQIEANTGRDGHKMKIIAILTAIFLPGTFLGVLLTVPMFNWDDPASPLMKKLPTTIYFGTTGPLTFLFLIWAITYDRLKKACEQLHRSVAGKKATKTRQDPDVDGRAARHPDVESGFADDPKTGIRVQTSWSSWFPHDD